MAPVIEHHTIPYHDWVDMFAPIQNPLMPNRSANFDGTMFETFGDDLKYIRDFIKEDSLNTWKVWTLVEEDGIEWITNGYHWVNRMGYFITEASANPKAYYDIELYDEEERTEMARMG